MFFPTSRKGSESWESLRTHYLESAKLDPKVKRRVKPETSPSLLVPAPIQGLSRREVWGSQRQGTQRSRVCQEDLGELSQKCHGPRGAWKLPSRREKSRQVDLRAASGQQEKGGQVAPFPKGGEQAQEDWTRERMRQGRRTQRPELPENLSCGGSKHPDEPHCVQVRETIVESPRPGARVDEGWN